MNVQSKQILALLTLCLSVGSATAGTLTVNTVEPTGPDVIVAIPTSPGTSGTPEPNGARDTFTQAFNDGTTGAGAGGDRGQSFMTPANGQNAFWDVSSMSLRAESGAFAQDFTTNGPANLRLWVFEWNPIGNAADATNWKLGDGVSDGNPFDLTGVSTFLINSEVYSLSGTLTGGEYLHFATPGLLLEPQKAYGMLVSFETGGGAAQSLRLDAVRDDVNPQGQGYLSGMNIRSQALTNDVVNNNASDELVFYLQATVVPEPGTVALFATGFAFVCASLARRKSRQ